MLDTLFNRGGADWKKYKGPYKFWIEDAETGEVVVEKQVDLFKHDFTFIDILGYEQFGFGLYTPDWKIENFDKEFPDGIWSVSLISNHIYKVNYAYRSDDLISFCKTFPILDGEGDTLLTALGGQYDYYNAYWQDNVFRRNLMYVDANSNPIAYALPIDRLVLDYGQYEGGDLLSLQSGVDLVHSVLFEYSGSAEMDFPMVIRPFPIASVFRGIWALFQGYDLTIRIAYA